MATKKTPGGMTPGSRNVSVGAMKAGMKKMDEAKARAASRSDAAKPIKPTKPTWTVASLTSAIRKYESYLAPGKMPKDLNRARVQSAIQSMSDQLAKLKKK